MQNIGLVQIDGIREVTTHLRKFALVIILTRAGLEMDPEAFKKIWPTIIKLSIVPWTVTFSKQILFEFIKMFFYTRLKLVLMPFFATSYLTCHLCGVYSLEL